MSDVDALKQALADNEAFEHMKAAAAEEESELLKLEGIVEAAYLVATADGDLGDAETDRLFTAMQTITDGCVDEEQLTAMLDAAADRAAEEDVEARCNELAEWLPDEASREAALMVAGNLAWAAGGVNAGEGTTLQALARAFGVELSAMHQILAKARGGVE